MVNLSKRTLVHGVSKYASKSVTMCAITLDARTHNTVPCHGSGRNRSFNLRPVRVGFVVDKLTLRQIFHSVLLFSPVFVFSPMLHIHYHRHYRNSDFHSPAK